MYSNEDKYMSLALKIGYPIGGGHGVPHTCRPGRIRPNFTREEEMVETTIYSFVSTWSELKMKPRSIVPLVLIYVLNF